MTAEWMKVIEYSLGAASVLGCFFVIFVFLNYKQLRSFPFESVVYLTISATLTTIFYLIYYIPKDKSKFTLNETYCKVQAFGIVWFENSQYMWASLIGYSVYQSVIHFEENTIRTGCLKRSKYLIAGYVLPLLLAVVCLARGVFGPSGKWCWIDTVNDNNLEKKIFSSVLYWLVWISILANFILNVCVVRYLNKQFTSKQERALVRGYIWKLLRYPIIQIICVFPGSINRFLQVVIDYDLPALQFLQLIFSLSQGLLYAIAYGYTTQVRKALLESMRTYFPCLCCMYPIRKESESSERSDNTKKLFDKSDQSEHNITYEDDFEIDKPSSQKSDKKLNLI